MSVNERERPDPLVEIAVLAEELCDPREHVEQLWGWTKSRHRKVTGVHKTVQPGLVEQLRAAVHEPAGVLEEEGRRGRSNPSRPPLQLEALARLLDIGLFSNEWMSATRLEHRGGIEANIRALVGAVGGMDRDLQHHLLHDLRRWRGWAAVMSGWALPPYQPHVVCPRSECGQLGMIRIILERKTGLCVACQTVWDDRDGSINVLARHIEAETSKPHTKVPIRSTAQGHGGCAARRVQ